MNKNKIVALMLACALVVGGTVGGTIAWLTAKTDEVQNVFTTSDIGVTLTETTTDYKMIPGWTIDKDPKASVTEGSEAAWLFVKIDESKNFDDYMTYQIAEGWETVVSETSNDDGTKYTVIGRKVTENFGTKYSVLKDDQVTVLETVTEAMMKTAKTSQPTLTFTAYAVQLWKSNEPAAGATEEQIAAAQFTAADAWAQAQTLNNAN